MAYKLIPFLTLNVNGKKFACTDINKNIFTIYNLGPVPATKIGFHVEPSKFVDGSKNRYSDDWLASKAWILTPYSDGISKIVVIIDGTGEYEVSYGRPGSAYNLPVTFKRTAPKSKKVTVPSNYPLPNKQPDYTIDIYPLYGNDNTIYGRDWTEKINYKYHNPTKSSADFVNSDGYNKDNYVGDHLFNSQYFMRKLDSPDTHKNEDDKMTIEIRAIDHPEYDELKMIEACENIVLSIYYPTKDYFPNDIMYMKKQTYALDKYKNSGL
jgi:hypothetical protein